MSSEQANNSSGIAETLVEPSEGEGEVSETKPKFINESESVDDKKEDGSPESSHEAKKGGRRKITIEFIENKSRRHVTFSKRKAGLIKKAYELSTLTGTQVLLLVASETGNVYTFATPKLQPLITKPEGKTLIQSCLNPPEVTQQHPQPPSSNQQRLIAQEPGLYTPDKKEGRMMKDPSKSGPPSLGDIGSFPNSASYPSSGSNPSLMSPNPSVPSVMYSYGMPSMGPFVHPNRGVPYSQGYPGGPHSYQSSGQYSNQMQQQQPPSQGYPFIGYSGGQNNSSFSSHEASSSPRHTD